MVDYDWPASPGFSGQPTWTGRGFRLGDTIVPVLSYAGAQSGWTDELTRFHEETAGASHSIDHASRRHAIEQLERNLTQPSPAVLEVGCSSGFMLRLMRERLPHAFLIGSDYVRQPLEALAAATGDVPLLQFDLVHCPLPGNSLDGVVLLNVLEHIEDDAAAVRQIHRILKIGGVAVVEVPAGPHLYDVYDKLLLHHRRYTMGSLRGLFERAGFRVVDRSHLGVFAYPLFWLVKQRNKRFLSAGNARQEQVVARNIIRTEGSRLLDLFMRAELTLGRRFAYPFGTRCLFTCIKAANSHGGK